jgi:hypothetical protein
VNLSQLVELMQAQSAGYAAEITSQVWGVLGYDDEHMMWADLSARVEPSVRLLLRLMGEDRPPRDDDLTYAASIGEARALQGVPVDAVLYSWMAAQRVLMARLLDRAGELSPADLRDATRRLISALEALTWRSVASYRETQGTVTTMYDRPAADFVAQLAGPEPPDAAVIARRAQLVGAPIDIPYTAVAVGSQYGLSSLLPAQRHLQTALRAHLGTRVLVGQVQQFAMMLVPTADGGDGLLKVLRQALEDRACPSGTVVGSGETAETLADVGPSTRQASQAAEVANRLQRYGVVVSFADVVPEVLILHNRGLIDFLTASQLGALHGRPELIETLSAFLRNGLSVRRTAAAMFMHPNTVLYRLKRLRELLGRDLRDVESMVDLMLAMRAARLFGADERS